MIDTIVLILEESDFKIFKHDLFYPNASKILDPSFYMGGSYVRSIQNPTKTELSRGIYKPRLTLVKRYKSGQSYQITLKVEYSVPKLLFGNNFDELEDKDVNQATKTLRSVLNTMGVATNIGKIESARVVAIHYSKNIPLVDRSSASMYLQELSKVNMNAKLDVNQTDFRNGGHSIKFRTNKREVVFYDKLKDLQQARYSEKRSEETDNAIQLDLFTERKLVKPLEVLRLEIRLGDKNNIRRSLQRSDLDVSLRYKDLCKESVSREIVYKYWTDIRDEYIPSIGVANMSNHRYLMMMVVSNKSTKMSTLLQVVGAKAIVDEIGIRDFRRLLESTGYTGWYRLKNMLKSINVDDNFSLFSNLDKALKSYIPLRLIDFEGEMINNDKYGKQAR